MKRHGLWMMAAMALVLSAGCSKKSWELDYGETVAHFNEESLLEKGEPYLDEMITVKGVVTKRDLSDPKSCKLYLGHGICCNFGDLKAMAESYAVGSTAFVSGFLKRLEPEDILLEPAMGRDPKAPFHPVE